ncbi:MAG: hypothetical protein P8Z40_16440, partial [Chloroflexota bacterium]
HRRSHSLGPLALFASPNPGWCASPPPVPLGLTTAPDTTTAPLRGRLVSGAAGSVAGGDTGTSLPPRPTHPAG